MIPKGQKYQLYYSEVRILRPAQGANTSCSEDKYIQKEKSLETSGRTHKSEKSLKCEVFHARLAGLGQLGLLGSVTLLI